MQLPLDWYVYIIPGSLFLLTIILLLPYKDLSKLKDFISEGKALLILPMMIVFSFLIGQAADSFIHIAYKIKCCIFSTNHIDKPNEILYVRMAFSRLLAFSSTFLIILSVFKIYKRTSSKLDKILIKYGRVIVLLTISLIALGIWYQYCANKSEFIITTPKKCIEIQAIDSLQNDSTMNKIY
jgi:hypothetical protein